MLLRRLAPSRECGGSRTRWSSWRRARTRTQLGEHRARREHRHRPGNGRPSLRYIHLFEPVPRSGRRLPRERPCFARSGGAEWAPSWLPGPAVPGHPSNNADTIKRSCKCRADGPARAMEPRAAQSRDPPLNLDRLQSLCSRKGGATRAEEGRRSPGPCSSRGTTGRAKGRDPSTALMVVVRGSVVDCWPRALLTRTGRIVRLRTNRASAPADS
jgi:hypothetical protein